MRMEEHVKKATTEVTLCWARKLNKNEAGRGFNVGKELTRSNGMECIGFSEKDSTLLVSL